MVSSSEILNFSEFGHESSVASVVLYCIALQKYTNWSCQAVIHSVSFCCSDAFEQNELISDMLGQVWVGATQAATAG